MTEEKSGIEQAVNAAGSQAKLADALSVTPQFIGTSIRKGYLPLERAHLVNELYGIPLIDLVRPDIASAMRATR